MTVDCGWYSGPAYSQGSDGAGCSERLPKRAIARLSLGVREEYGRASMEEIV